ncbi:MAG: host attachment protein [Polaromonas sp.]|nr:host attachment protein [Polaromonas sp.]
MMKPDWILIANASQARLLQREHGNLLVVLDSFEHPESRSKISDLADDKMGWEKADRGFGGSAYQAPMDAKQKEHMRFARELADHLEPQALQGSFRSLAIFASSPFLGELKTELGAATARLLSSTHDLDLTSFDLGELEQRVASELAPFAR